MNNVDNAIYHVLKIVHKNVILPIYTSHTEGYHMQLFLVRCHIQRLNGSVQCLQCLYPHTMKTL